MCGPTRSQRQMLKAKAEPLPFDASMPGAKQFAAKEIKYFRDAQYLDHLTMMPPKNTSTLYVTKKGEANLDDRYHMPKRQYPGERHPKILAAEARGILTDTLMTYWRELPCSINIPLASISRDAGLVEAAARIVRDSEANGSPASTKQDSTSRSGSGSPSGSSPPATKLARRERKIKRRQAAQTEAQAEVAVPAVVAPAAVAPAVVGPEERPFGSPAQSVRFHKG